MTEFEQIAGQKPERHTYQRKALHFLKGFSPGTEEEKPYLTKDELLQLGGEDLLKDSDHLLDLIELKVMGVDISSVLFEQPGKMYLNNSAVPKSMPPDHALKRIVITEDDARFIAQKCKWNSFVGHPDSAQQYSTILQTEVPNHAGEYELKSGDIVLVGEKSGRRDSETVATYDPLKKTWSLNVCIDFDKAVQAAFTAGQHSSY